MASRRRRAARIREHVDRSNRMIHPRQDRLQHDDQDPVDATMKPYVDGAKPCHVMCADSGASPASASAC